MAECISCQTVSAARSMGRLEELCRHYRIEAEGAAANALVLRQRLDQVTAERDGLAETVDRQNVRLRQLAAVS